MLKRIRKSQLLFLAALAVLIPSVVNGQVSPLTVEEVIARALEESPEVKEISLRLATRRAVGIETGTLSNPTLDSELRLPVSDGDNRGNDEIAVSLSQPIRPSDFGSRSQVEGLITQEALAEEKLELLGLKQRVRLAFAKTWALGQRAEEMKKYLERSTKIEAGIAKASESGFISPGERALFKAEGFKVRYQLAAVVSDLKRARAQLSKVAGFTVPELLSRPGFATLPSEEILSQEGGKLPAQGRAALALELAREQLKLAELDAYPKFAPRLVYERTNDSTDYVGIGISIDLPFFNRNQAAKTERAAELSASQSFNRYYQGSGFLEEVKALRSSVESQAALLNGYESEILPTLREAVLGEEKLLLSGQGSFFRVWQTLRELSNAESETVERTIAVFADRAELSILTGIDF